MTINKHTLIHAPDAGNGYHGRCQHCGVALVTDLGYCSWNGVKCIDREISNEEDIPSNIRSFASFRGLVFAGNMFVKPYSSETYTIDQLNTIINSF